MSRNRTAMIGVLLLAMSSTPVLMEPQQVPASEAAVPGNIAAERKHADELFEQGKTEEAKVIYQRIATSYTKDFDLNIRLAYCYFVSKKKEMAKAAVYYGRAHALKPKNVEAEINWAKTLSWSKQYPQAIKVFREIVARDPADRTAWLELARAQNYSGDPQGARASYETYLKRWPADREVRLEFATYLSWNKLYDESLEQFGVLLKAEPHNANALAGEAQVFAWKGELQKALDTYDQALARSPKLYAALRGKAYTLLWLERFEDAAKEFARANAVKKPDDEVKQALDTIAKWRAAEPERRRQAELDVYLRPAGAAVARSDFATAIDLFRKALVLYPGNEDLRFRLAEACLWDKRWDDAIELFRKLREEHPDNVNYVRELAYAYTGAKRLPEAVTLLREYLQRTSDLNIRLQLARVQSWGGKLGEAAAEYRAILSAAPSNFEAALGLAQVTAWEGKYAEALAAFDELLRRYPDSREAQLGRAQVLAWSGRGGEAVPLLEAMVRARPEDREIVSALQAIKDAAKQQAEQQRYASTRPEDIENRIRHDEAALKQHPNDAKLLERIGDAYTQLKRYNEAISNYDKALAIHPDDAALQLTIARVTSWNRDYTRSIALYESLLQKEDKRVYRVELAQVLSWAGRNRESIAQYEDLLAHEPDDVSLRLGLARVLSWDQRPEEALLEYSRVLDRQPTNRDAMFERARAYAWKGDYATALKLYDELLINSPLDWEVRLAKAQALNWSGQPREAKRIIDDVQKAHPDDRDAVMANAAVQSALGRPDIALRLLDDLDKLQPGSRDVESLRRSIRQDLQPTLVLGFVPSFDSDRTDIYASTATVYFSPTPQFRSYFAATLIPSFVPTSYQGEMGREFLFGSYGRVSKWLQLRGEVGLSVGSGDPTSPIGSGGFTFFATDKMQFDFDASRRFVNYLPQPVALNISRVVLRAGWSWRATRRTTFHIDGYHERYSDENRNNAANFSVMQTLLRREHFELEAGYLFSISGFDHVGNSGFFTPTSFQRHAALGNTRIIFSQRNSISFWGSFGQEEVFNDPFRIDGTARASWDFKITPKLRTSIGYGYFAVSSVGGTTAYTTHTLFSGLQYVF